MYIITAWNVGLCIVQKKGLHIYMVFFFFDRNMEYNMSLFSILFVYKSMYIESARKKNHIYCQQYNMSTRHVIHFMRKKGGSI
jgi:hypothetical protein